MTSGKEINRKTHELLNNLKNTDDVRAFIDIHDREFIDGGFTNYICRLAADKGMVREHIIRQSGIDRSYGHQIFEGRRRPSRDKVIQLAIGMRLSVDETQKMLQVAGFSPLYVRIRRDVIILYCISHKKGLADIQDMLYREGSSMLGKY